MNNTIYLYIHNVATFYTYYIYISTATTTELSLLHLTSEQHQQTVPHR